MKKFFNLKIIVYVVFGLLISGSFALNFVKVSRGIEQNYDISEFKFQLNKEIEANPNFLEETFDIPNDTELTDEKIEELSEIAKQRSYKYVIFISVVITLLIVAVLFVPIMVFVLPFFTSNSAFKKYKLSEEDFKGSKDYFRDTLNEYTPSELSFIDDLKIDKNAIIADLLLLEQKKYIIYEDGIFRRGENKEFNRLNPIEKYLLSQVLDEGSNYLNISLIKFAKLVKDQSYKDGLTEDKQFPAAKFFKDVFISVLCFLLIMYFFGGSKMFVLIEESNPTLQFLGIGLFAFFVIFSIYYPMYIIYKYVILFIRLNLNKTGRTDKGEEINKKLEGLKIFIRDFSILEGREKRELILWKEYLVYSVMFNMNKKIVNEYNLNIRYVN